MFHRWNTLINSLKKGGGDRMNISMSEIAQLLPSSSVSKQVRLVVKE